MPIPSSINDLSTTASSNSPAGGDSPGDGDDFIRALSSFVALLRDKLNGTSATGTVKQPVFDGTATGSLIGATLTTPTLNGLVTFGEGWTLDTSGRLRNTSNEQPHFYAKRTTSQTTGTTVIFATEVTDQGGVYNNATGVFTAPVAGMYLLTAAVCIKNQSGAAAATALRMTGSTAGVIADVPLFQDDTLTKDCYFNAVVRLAASETVSFGLASGASFSNSNLFVSQYSESTASNYFSGVLLN